MSGRLHSNAPGATTIAGDPVREFFDRQVTDDQYATLKHQTRVLNEVAAAHLHASVRGDLLAIGGVWDHFQWMPTISSFTVLDLSTQMLDAYCPDRATAVEGNLYEVDFAEDSFDTIVFPLMLHHTPVDNWPRSEQRVRDAIARAARWLRPGGEVFILEYCPNDAVYALERAAYPVTRRFLAAFGQPPVVMYSRRFYLTVLRHQFGNAESARLDPPGVKGWGWYPVFMGVRWLKIPLALYPKLHLLSAGNTERSR